MRDRSSKGRRGGWRVFMLAFIHQGVGDFHLWFVPGGDETIAIVQAIRVRSS